MFVSNILDVSALKKRMAERSKASERAAVLTINKAATYALKESIEEIKSNVNLKTNYLRKNMGVGQRASVGNLRTEINANARGTLLARYPFQKAKRGIRVSVNAGSGMRLLPKAFIVPNLRGSLSTGIGFRNTDALAYFEWAYSKGKMTSGKQNKLSKLRVNAKDKPRGIYIHHSRSVNQLFKSTRVDIQPRLRLFMRTEFINDLERLSI